MLASIIKFPSVKEKVLTRKEIVIDAAQSVSKLAGMISDLNHSVPDGTWLRAFESVNDEVTYKVNYIENLLKEKREQGDIHIQRVIQDLKRTQARYIDIINQIH